jgi:bacteriorhodopsin
MASCGEKGTVWVCHFWPPGNVVGEVPFCEENMLGGMGRCPGSGGVQPHGCQGVVRGAPKSNQAEGHGAAAETGDGHGGGEAGDFLAPEGRDGEGGDEGEQMAQHVDATVVVEGLAASQFDDIVFAGVVAESLSVPLYRVTVSLPGDGERDDAAHHRRLLSSPTRLSVELTVWCGETGVCERLQSKLNGLECNGRLASALSAAFKATIRTPECPSTVYHPPAGMPGSVTFPDAFPNSVRHWLLIGFLGTGIGAAAAFYLALGSPRELTMPSVLASMVCAIAMVSYYCMWSGVGVTLKTAGSTPRVIFYTKYLDWAVSTPLILTTLGSIGGADKPTIVAMVGNDVLMVTCGLIGTFLIAPYKYVWWFLGMVFFAIVLLLVLRVVQRGGNEGHLRTLGIILAVSWGVYPVLWLLGSEGTGALGLSQEVALTVLTDLASKVLFSLLVVSWTAGKEVEEGEGERGMGVESGMV